MAGNLTDYSEDAILTFLLAGTVYFALHTGDPSETGANNEVGGGVGYARVAGTMTGTGSTRSNAANVTFGPATGGGFGTVTHCSVWSAAVGGNCLLKGALTAGQLIPAGIPATFVAGALTFSPD